MTIVRWTPACSTRTKTGPQTLWVHSRLDLINKLENLNPTDRLTDSFSASELKPPAAHAVPSTLLSTWTDPPRCPPDRHRSCTRAAGAENCRLARFGSFRRGHLACFATSSAPPGVAAISLGRRLSGESPQRRPGVPRQLRFSRAFRQGFEDAPCVRRVQSLQHLQRPRRRRLVRRALV
jgi:hypothetical protein